MPGVKLEIILFKLQPWISAINATGKQVTQNGVGELSKRKILHQVNI